MMKRPTPCHTPRFFEPSRTTNKPLLLLAFQFRHAPLKFDDLRLQANHDHTQRYDA